MSPMQGADHLRMTEPRFDLYLHDGATRFRMTLGGALVGGHVLELEHAWGTAMSMLRGKQLVVELQGLEEADAPGMALLRKMEDAGATLEGRLGAAPAGGRTEKAKAGWRRMCLPCLF